MSFETTFKNALYDWVYAVLNVPVIWANQNAPRPDYPYVVLNIVNSTQENFEVRTNVTALGAFESTAEQMRYSISVIAITDDVIDVTAISLLDKLKRNAERKSATNTTRAILTNANIAVISIEQVLDTTAVLGTDFMSQANTTIDFRIAREETDTTTAPYFEEVSIEGSVAYEEDGDTVDITISVTK